MIECRPYSKLRGLMAEKSISLRNLSELSGIPLSTLSNKLSGQTEFKVSEVLAISEVLDISEIELYFFTE